LNDWLHYPNHHGQLVTRTYFEHPGCFHRDVKLSNVLLGLIATCLKYIAKLADFGSARLASEDATQTGSVGTKLFMSPEELNGEANVNLGACDVWSTAVVIVYLLTGHHPFLFSLAETEAQTLVS
jgi:serine/threonine protein kinase